MGKLIAKTAFITALILILTVFLGAVVVFFAAPKFSAKVCHNLGMKNAATTCYVRVYEKTGTFDDLVEAVDSAVYSENREVIAEYGLKMFDVYGNSFEFEQFCKNGDVGKTENDYKTYDYYATLVFNALYSTDKKAEAANFAIVSLDNGYNDKCALKMAVKMANPSLDSAFGQLLITAYKTKKLSISQMYTDFVKEMKDLGYKF